MDKIYYLIKYKVNYCNDEKVKLFDNYDEAVKWHKNYNTFANKEYNEDIKGFYSGEPRIRIPFRYITHFDIIALKIWDTKDIKENK